MAEERAKELRCAECGRVAQWCAVCDKDDCGDCLCYRCAAVALKELIPQPHVHGG